MRGIPRRQKPFVETAAAKRGAGIDGGALKLRPNGFRPSGCAR